MLSKDEFSFGEIEGEIALVHVIKRADQEAVVVTTHGLVILFNLGSGKSNEIGTLDFDPSSQQVGHPLFVGNLQVHAFQNYIAVTQVYGSYGRVFDLEDPSFSKTLNRGDYHPEVSRFPLGFYSDNSEVFLIHATDWNRLDITRLKSDELLTDRVVDFETDQNYFDYFHCGLFVSPDSKSFMSNGWHWHPFGRITWYSIERFLKEFEMSHVDLELTDDSDAEDPYNDLGWDRPLCWIGTNTVGVGYNRAVGYYGEEKTFASEVLIYDVFANRITDRIEFEGFAVSTETDVSGDLFYDAERSQLIGLNKRTGLLISDLDGKRVQCMPELAGWKYCESNRLFYDTDKKARVLKLAMIV